MNKNLHKVIFNRNLGLMIAVSETAHNSGKSSKDKIFQVALLCISGNLNIRSDEDINLTDTQDYYHQVDKSGFGKNVNFKAIGDSLKGAVKMAAKTMSPTKMTYDTIKAKNEAYKNNKGEGAKGQYDGIHAAATSSLSQLGDMGGESPIGFNLTKERSQTTANNRSDYSVGSEIQAAGKLNIQSDEDITVSGSLLFGGEEINAMGKNINILSANESSVSDVH